MEPGSAVHNSTQPFWMALRVRISHENICTSVAQSPADSGFARSS
jgi:hypothetical protein